MPCGSRPRHKAPERELSSTLAISRDGDTEDGGWGIWGMGKGETVVHFRMEYLTLVNLPLMLVTHSPYRWDGACKGHIK